MKLISESSDEMVYKVGRANVESIEPEAAEPGGVSIGGDVRTVLGPAFPFELKQQQRVSYQLPGQVCSPDTLPEAIPVQISFGKRGSNAVGRSILTDPAKTVGPSRDGRFRSMTPESGLAEVRAEQPCLAPRPKQARRCFRPRLVVSLA